MIYRIDNDYYIGPADVEIKRFNLSPVEFPAGNIEALIINKFIPQDIDKFVGLEIPYLSTVELPGYRLEAESTRLDRWAPALMAYAIRIRKMTELDKILYDL